MPLLTEPTVRAALQSAEKSGFRFPTQTGTTPPDITGYYVKPSGTGKYVASGDGTDIGGPAVGMETRFTVYDDGTLDRSYVTFGSGPALFTIESGTDFRGEGNQYTFYYRSTQTCASGADEYVLERAGIASGRVEAATGDLVDTQFLNVTLDVSEPLPPSCDLGGNGELKGGWSMYLGDRFKLVSPDELAYMCLDGSEAYVPTESWTTASGESCTCLPDLTIECDG